MTSRNSLIVTFALAGLFLSGGCGDDIVGPSKGTIVVGLQMSGDTPDMDGFTVMVDGGAPKQIFAGSGLSFEDLVAGSHIIELADIADHCTLVGQNPRAVSVKAGGTAETVFDVSCGSPTTGAMTLADVIATAGAYEEAEPKDTVTDTSIESELREDGTTWTCTVERHSAVDAPDDYATFNPNAEVIYPGSMLQGATLVDATPEPVVVRRAGGTVVINLLNASEGVSEQVDEVRQSSIVQAINDILRANSQVVPARFTYTSEEVQSREQLALSLGVNVSTLSADIRSKLSFDTDRKYNRFLVHMVQSFYTVSFDLPRSLDELFHPSVTADDLAPYVGPGNPPTYISSVTYGRRFVLLIESTSSVSEMKASIRASYDAAVVSVDLGANVKYVKDLENVNIKVFALGGDQSMATAMFNGDFQALQSFLTQGADIKTGVPLSYVVRNVLDNTIVGVKVATDYDVKSCVPIIAEQLYSGFEQSAEGWTSYDNGGVPPEWLTETTCNGGTGPCIRLRDASGGSKRLRAPLSWRDEKAWTAFYGGTIKYYGWITGADSWNSVGSDLVIQGPNGTLVFNLPWQYPRVYMWQGWKYVSVNLDEAGTVFSIDGVDVTSNWRYGSGSGPEATADQIKAVLANVTDFTIRGDYRGGTDYLWVDEVEINTGAGGGSAGR
jgi:hypothetical protein